MKKFILILVLGMVFGACGADPGDCTCTPEEEEFFEKYYADCVDLCNACETWANDCGHTFGREPYNVDACIWWAWRGFVSNSGCALSNLPAECPLDTPNAHVCVNSQLDIP
jgi:hypothetical protein